MSVQTKMLVVGADGASSPAIREAAEILASGGLVAFPTETVYGIGANADDLAARERLRALKGRPDHKPFSVHIADKGELRDVVSWVPLAGRKLVDRYWPGPLTIIFGHGADSVGVRVPAHDIATAFIRACGVRVVAPSANRAGKHPASSAAEVAEIFNGKIDAILDGGDAPLRQSSTVVRVWRNGWELLRQGIISEKSIRRALKTNILFVCTGNSCRSPVAEALCREVLATHLDVDVSDLPALGYEVASAGTATAGGGRASESASAAATGVGLDLSRHRTQALTVELLRNADKVYAMAESHAAAARDLCPGAADKIELLDPEGGAIDDPIGLRREEFARVVQRMRECLEGRVKEL